MIYNGFIYIARSDTGHIKIGLSKHPFQRIKHFDTIMPVKVDMIHFFPCDNPSEAEKLLHKHYEYYRTTGEWFDIPEGMESMLLSIRFYLNGEFVYQIRDEPWMNSCCLDSIQEAVIRGMILEVNDKWVRIIGEPVELEI